MTLDLSQRFDGAKVWASLSPDRQAAIGAIVLELLAAWYAQEEAMAAEAPSLDEDDPFPALQRAADAADFALMTMLREAMVDAVPRSELEGANGNPLIPSLLGPVCRNCGCSENDACWSVCSWAEPDLCSACVEKAKPA